MWKISADTLSSFSYGLAFVFSLSPCRYGEHSTPFCVSVVGSCRRGDGEFSRRIYDAVERASLDVQSGSSSDEEESVANSTSCSSSSSLSVPCPAPIPPSNPEPKTIPTVSNPNSVYRVGWKNGNISNSCIWNCDSSAQSLPLFFDPQLLFSSSVQRVCYRRPSDLANLHQEEALCWGCTPTSCSFTWWSDLSILQPERLQVPSSHLHIHRASCGQVPLGQQIPILVPAEPSTQNQVIAQDGTRNWGHEKKFQDSLCIFKG